MKRLTAFLLTIALFFTLPSALPLAFAEETSGTLDGDIHWTVDDGVLTFTGQGSLPSYKVGDLFGYDTTPWRPFAASIWKIVLSDGITGAGEYTFPFLPALESVVMAKSVTHIGYMAFSGCNALTTLTLGDGVQTLGNGCFMNCKSLSALSLPLSLQKVESSAFAGCDALHTAEYPGKEAEFTDRVTVDAGNELLKKALHFTDSSSTGGFLGESAAWSFKNGTLTISGSGALPDYTASGYTARPFEQFADKIREIVCPKRITAFGDYLFAGLTALQSLTLSDGITSLGTGCFQGCTSLRTVALGSGLAKIGENAFAGCVALENAVFDGPVEGWLDMEMGDGNEPLLQVLSFSEAPIISGRFSDSVTWSFQSGHLTVEGSGEIPDGVTPSERFGDALTRLTVSEGITGVGKGAFQGAAALSEVSLPWSLRKVGENAFADCAALKTVSYPGSKEDFASVKVESGNDALSAALHFENLPVYGGVLSDTLTWSCEDGVLTILGSGEIPDLTPDTQPWKAFVSEITKISLPEGLTRIGASAFAGCAVLGEVNLPSTLKEVGENAFAGCAAMKTAVFAGTRAQWESGVKLAAGNDALSNALSFAPTALRGDMNGDGKVNPSDRTYLARALAKWSGYVLPGVERGDVNGDGKVNPSDRTYLARAFANWTGYEL